VVKHSLTNIFSRTDIQTFDKNIYTLSTCSEVSKIGRGSKRSEVHLLGVDSSVDNGSDLRLENGENLGNQVRLVDSSRGRGCGRSGNK